MTMTTPPFPFHTLDWTPIISSFNLVSKANDNLDYLLAINYASDAIELFKRSCLFHVLDHRIHAYCKKYKYEAAIKDAQEMISIAPNLATGYFKLASIYSFQGKPKKAIDVYDKALRNNHLLSISSAIDNSDNDMDHHSILVQQLADRKKMALEQDRKRVDFVSLLPQELSMLIFAALDQKSKTTCWSVSKRWHSVTLLTSSAAMLWPTLYIDHDDDMGFQILNHLLPCIGRNAVRELTLDTKNEYVCSNFLTSICDGKLMAKSFKLKKNTVERLHPVMLRSLMSIGIPALGNGLTELELNCFTSDHVTKEIIRLDNLLCVAPNLKYLVYETTYELSSVIDDFKGWPTIKSHPLVYLQLYTEDTTRREIQVLLEKCSQLRCLKLSNCAENVTDLLASHCPDLQIFCLNHYWEENYDMNDLNIAQKRKRWQELLYGKNTTPGLKEFYGIMYSEEGVTEHDPVPALIRNNMATLEVIEMYRCYDPSDIRHDYTALNMPNLRCLVIDMDRRRSVAKILIESLRFFPALTKLHLESTHGLRKIVDALLALDRPLQSLNFSMNGIMTTDNEDPNADLIRLFQHYYAAYSGQSNIHSKSRMTPKVETIHIADPHGVLTDSVLYALSNIKTIRNIGIESISPHITAEGLNTLFKRLSGTLAFVELNSLVCVTDKNIVSFANLLKENLAQINLYHLKHLTVYGVLVLMEKTIRLKKMKINDCRSIDSNKMVDFIKEFATSQNIDVSANH